MVDAVDADDLLDDVGRPVDVAAPAGDADLRLLVLERPFEAQAGENRLLLGGRYLDTAEAAREVGIIVDAPRRERRGAGADHLGRLAAADRGDEPGQDGEAVVEEGGIDAALEAGARVRRERERLAGAGDALGIEISDLEQQLGGGFGDGRMLAAHDAADIVNARVVGDHRHFGGERVGLAVERLDGFAVAGAAGDDGALELRKIIGVAGAAEVEHHVIADVDDRRDGPLANGLEAALHPLGRGAVADAADHAAVEGGAAFGVVGADFGRCTARFARDPSTALRAVPLPVPGRI